MKLRKLFCLFAAVSAVWSARAETHPRAALNEFMPVRGFCIAAPRPDGVDRFIGFIDRELAPRHINTLVLRVDYNYQFKSHPELREHDALSTADVKKMVAACRRHGIKIIPEIDLLGHQSYRTHVESLLRVYPQFDETPWIKIPREGETNFPAGYYCKSYCPLHPGVHAVVFAVMDELCDVFESDTFHAGMDEVFYLGEDKCPRCAGHNKAQLFADEVRRIHDHLQEHGRTMWMWGDRLIDGRTTGVGMWEGSYNDTQGAIDLIPKDVVICDWHYDHPDPTAAYFAVKGFRVITCPWKSAHWAVVQTDDMAHLRATATPVMRDRFQGMMQTVWSSTTSFLDKDYAGRGGPANCWTCFTAMMREISRLEGQAMPPTAKQ